MDLVKSNNKIQFICKNRIKIYFPFGIILLENFNINDLCILMLEQIKY